MNLSQTASEAAKSSPKLNVQSSSKSPQEIFSKLTDGSQIFIHGASATPTRLIHEFVQATRRLKDLKIFHLHTEGPPEYVDATNRERFLVRNLFVGSNFRKLIDFDRIDYIPCFLSEMPLLFRSGKIKLDLALIQTSLPADADDCVSIGTSVDTALAALQSAQFRVAQVNAQMPFIHGDGILPLSTFDAWITCDDPIYISKTSPLTEIDIKIGQNVASLIEDGSCLQLGIGAIPNSTLASLVHHKHLGLHSEMVSDGVVPLLEKGAIDNSQKAFDTGDSISSFLFGSQVLYRFVHQNKNFKLKEASYVNSPSVIARHKKMVSINSAVEVDLTGQVCADSVGSKIISGVGGQVDFIRGASLSEGGKPIIALPSRTKTRASRIVVTLHQGAGVVTTRAHVHYVITEYGIADLYAKSIGERARALIAIAHPDDRENLARDFHNMYRS